VRYDLRAVLARGEVRVGITLIPERVVALWPTHEGTEVALMPDDLTRLRHDSRALRVVAGFVHWGAIRYALTDADRPLVLPQARVTGNFFDVLGTRPVLGRLLRPEDDVAGAPPVIVLAYAAWRRHFGGDSMVLGRRLHLASFALDITVVGVAPPGLDYPSGTAYWAPYATTGDGPLDLVARLAPGAAPKLAGAELLATTRQLHPELELSGAEVDGLSFVTNLVTKHAPSTLNIAAGMPRDTRRR
jgi:putative ABC transport system permease protein